jgi:NAD(P)-dependent dehydrogenase (short-subunit alcohol dehydrogenase family)
MQRGTIVVITGGARGIGAVIARRFSQEGATVCIIDREENDFSVGDVGHKETIERFAARVINDHGHVDVLVNNAPPLMRGISTCSYEEFQTALAVGVSAPFYLTQRLLPHFSEGASIINITSTRQAMSQKEGESYAAAKGALASLTHALAISLGPRIRVNAIAPGWIDTTGTSWEGADSAQHPAGRVGRPSDIAEMVLFLSSERASFITGETITIDGGMSRLMVYHNDGGWSLTVPEEG